MGAAASSAPRRGAFFLFEGLDRCGKTTQCARLVEHLQASGVTVQHIRFPDRATATGQTINAYLEGKVELSPPDVHRLFVSNRVEKQAAMAAALSAGTTLVVDRYSFSGVAYSAAKDSPDMPWEWLKGCEAGLLAPDRVYFMHLSPEAGAARGGYGGERYEKQEFQEKVGKMFDRLGREPALVGRWRVVDASRSIEQIGGEIAEDAAGVLQRAGAGPLARLWDMPPVEE